MTIKRGTQTDREEHRPEYDLKGVLPFGVDHNGVARTVHMNDAGNLGVIDPILETSLGHGGVSHINKFGRNPTIDTNTDPEDIWSGGGLYVPPTQARVHNMVSTSTEDAGTLLSTGTFTAASAIAVIDTAATFVTDSVAIGDMVLNDTSQDHSIVTAIVSETELTCVHMHHETTNQIGETYRIVTPAGTGAAVLHIKQGLDSNFDMQSEFIILNGTTSVPTVSSYLRINRMHFHGTGSTGANVGTITATAVTDATVTAQIDPTLGQTLMAHYTIPRGKKGYLTNIFTSVNSKSTAVIDIALYEQLWAGNTPGVGDGRFIHGWWSASQAGGTLHIPYNPYKYISEFSDVWLRVESVSANATDVSGGFDMILVDHDL